ncbi:MAG: lipocalin family protein [Beijerinckiaceae bacterium]
MMFGRPAFLAILLLASAGCTGVPDGIAPVRPFDATRFSGVWYEVMRLDHSFERGLTNVTASYEPLPDGSLKVVNRGFDPSRCQWRAVDGRAVFQGAKDTASLNVTFFPPFAGGYHVFALDKRNYAWALISGPSKDYLWLLARRPDLDARTRERLIAEARSEGFPVDRLILVDHGAARCA